MSLALTRTAALGAFVALLAGTASASTRPRLVVAGDHENPPYEYLENGKPTGFNVELMRAAATIAGFEVEIRLGPWAQARRDLEEGKVDALSGMYWSEERTQFVDFSVPHTMVRSALFVREDSPIRTFVDLRGKEVILQEGDVRHDLFQRTGLASRIVAVTDADEQLRLLVAGRGDCALMTSRLQGEYYVKRLGLTGLRVIDADLPQLRYCFAVRKGNRELLYRLDEGLNVLKISGKYREIYERWFGIYERPDLWRYGKIFVVALAVLTGLFAASLVWSRSLQRQVRLRTAALQAREEELQRAHGELRQAHAELEQRVEARTAVLTRANERLRVSEREKEFILNSTSDVVTFLDPEMRLQWGNHRAATLARTTLDGLKGRHCFEAFHGRSTPCEGCPVAVALKTGEPQTAEMSHPGDEEIFLRAYPVKDEQGRQLGVVEFSLDISERKRVEVALRESEEWLKLTIEASGAGIFHCLPGGPLSWSSRCREMFGVPADYVIHGQEDHLRLVHPDDREMLGCALERALDPRGQGLGDVQYRCVWPDGTVRWIAGKFKIWFTEEHGVKRAIRLAGANFDITDRKREEQALRESEERFRETNERLREAHRRKDEFLAMLSHELRNPLAPIRNSIFVLRRIAGADGQLKRAVAVLDRQTQHMTRLVDDLLDVTRISRGKITLQKEGVDLNELVRAAVDDHREVFARARVELAFQDLPHQLHVYGDRTRLAQTLGNLLGNSVKFTPAGGRTSVSLDEHEGDAIIRVRDTGEGVPPEMRHRLFEPFFQADSTLDRTRGGLGLGLALVKGLVEMHGGGVEVESEGPGKGATFTVKLPLEREAGPHLAVVPSGGASSRRVLIIEDNLDAAQSLKEALEMGDHQVEVAYRGEEGVEKARAFHPDVVLCDIGLPGMDGYAVVRALRTDPQLRSLHVIAVSGYASPEDIERSRKAGFDHHVAKPTDLDALEKLLVESPRNAAAG